MQAKLDATRDKVEAFLNNNDIEFSITAIEIDSEDQTQKHTGYNIETSDIFAAIVPNYNNKKVEFLVLNQNLIKHLMEEGCSEEDIQSKAKIWTHFTKLSNFQKVFQMSKNF